jgi:hypothetical protein
MNGLTDCGHVPIVVGGFIARRRASAALEALPTSIEPGPRFGTASIKE